MMIDRSFIQRIWTLVFNKPSHKKLAEVDDQEMKAIDKLYRTSMAQEPDYAALWSNIEMKIEHPKQKCGSQFIRIAFTSAAAIVLVSGTAYFFHDRPFTHGVVADGINSPIMGSKVVLKMGDQLAYDLSQYDQQQTAAQPKAINIDSLVKMHRGKNRNTVEQAKITFSSVHVPVGESFSMLLSDGTKVHLNSRSSLEFPSQFGKEERTVKLTGEAFFEVKTDKNRPFRVQVNDYTVNAYGTKFNIHAYELTNSKDTPIYTTLVEGIVKVENKQQKCNLIPGKCAMIAKDTIMIHNADVDKVLLWQKGRYEFTTTSLDDLVHVLDRWYDIDSISWGQREWSKIRFTGVIDKSFSLQENLSFISASSDVEIVRQEAHWEIK